MDPTAQATLITQLTTYKTDAISAVTAVLPLALGVLITISLIMVGINTFKKVAGLH